MNKKLNAIIVSVVALMAGCLMTDSLMGLSHVDEVRANGQTAQAKVLRTWETGWSENRWTIVGMRLEVYPPEGEPFEVETRARVYQVHFGMITPGEIVPVKFDSADPSRVALDIYEFD